MALFKKKDETPKGKKPVKVVDISAKVNAKPKNATMWCSMHSCTKAACPGGMHN